MKAQFANRMGKVVCTECNGLSFADPTQEYHYPKCSRYKAWRFGGQPGRYYAIKDQVLHERAGRSLGHGCTCWNDEKTFPCEYCSWHEDERDEG